MSSIHTAYAASITHTSLSTSASLTTSGCASGKFEGFLEGTQTSFTSQTTTVSRVALTPIGHSCHCPKPPIRYLSVQTILTQLNITSAGESEDPASIYAMAEEARDNAEASFRAFMKEQGFIASPPLVLTVDESGKIRVSGSHEQKQKIETQLNLEKNSAVKNDLSKALGLQRHAAMLRQQSLYVTRFTSVYETRGMTATSSVTTRFASLNQPEFRFSYGLSGLSMRIENQTLTQWLEMSEKELDNA